MKIYTYDPSGLWPGPWETDGYGSRFNIMNGEAVLYSEPGMEMVAERVRPKDARAICQMPNMAAAIWSEIWFERFGKSKEGSLNQVSYADEAFAHPWLKILMAAGLVTVKEGGI